MGGESMEELEISGKTVEEATNKAEEQLAMSRDQFEVVVVKEGRSGVFGIGSEESVIRVKPLVTPGEDVVKVATEVLETLLGLMGVTGVVEVLSEEMPVSFNIEGDDLGILIGRRGQALSCLQHIVRLVVAGRLKTWLPLNIDVCGYKERRRESLQSLALRLAEQVGLRRRAITLEPMPPDERRIVHLALADHPEVVTNSIGEGEDRKVVILLRRE